MPCGSATLPFKGLALSRTQLSQALFARVRGRECSLKFGMRRDGRGPSGLQPRLLILAKMVPVGEPTACGVRTLTWSGTNYFPAVVGAEKPVPQHGRKGCAEPML